MLSEILIFNQIIEPFFSFPACFTFFLLFKSLLMFIDYGKGQAQVVFRVRVEVFRITRYLFTHLFLLELPDVKLLVTIHEYLNTLRDIHTLFHWSSTAHALDKIFVISPNIFG